MIGRVGWSRLFLVLIVGWSWLVACDTAAPSEGGMPLGQDVLYADNFDAETAANWQLEGDEAARAVIVEERLLIEVDQPNTVHYVTLAEQTFSDFLVAVDVTQLTGSTDSTFGILFRLVGEGENAGFYRFEVTGSGLYMVERRNEDGSWTRLTDEWVASSALQQGLNATNRLGVRAAGSAYSFYANDTLLLQLTDSGYPAGAIALDAGTFAQTGLQVAFDNLVVSQP